MAASNILERAYKSHNKTAAREACLKQTKSNSTSSGGQQVVLQKMIKKPLPHIADQYDALRNDAKASRQNKTTANRRMSKHKTAIHGFDKWLNTVLDDKTKQKMVNQFGYTFSQKKYKSNDPTGYRNKGDASESNVMRSHKLFESLSSNCSFESLCYPDGLDFYPRLHFFSPRFVSASDGIGVRMAPMLVHAHDQISYISADRCRTYDINGIPVKEKRMIVMSMCANGNEDGRNQTESTRGSNSKILNNIRKNITENETRSTHPHPIAVLKRSNKKKNFNNIELIYGVDQLKKKLEELITGRSCSSGGDEAVCIQKYIKPKGQTAWLVRIVWKLKEDCGTEGYSYVLNDTDKFVIDSKSPISCGIVKSASSKSWPEARDIMEKFVKLSEERLGKRFSMVAGDFIMESDGRWNFVQVKSFKLRDQIYQVAENKKTGEGGSKINDNPNGSNSSNMGKCCGQLYCHEQLTPEEHIVYPIKSQLHKISYKDILLDKFAKQELAEINQAGLKEEDTPVFVNLYKLETKMLQKINQRDKLRLYNSVSVCGACHNRITTNKKLMEDTVNVDLAKAKMAKNQKKEKERLVKRAVIDAKIKGGRGAVGLDDFIQNAKHLQNLGEGDGENVGGGVLVGAGEGGSVDAIALLEEGGEGEGQQAEIKKNEGEEEEEDYDEILKRMLEDNKREAEAIIYNEGVLDMSEEERTRLEQEAIERKVNEAFNGYNPEFAVDIDSVMGKMNDEMDNISLGAKYASVPKKVEKKNYKVLNDEGNDVRSPVIKFRPVHSVRINEARYWSNEDYKEEALGEILDTINRGMKCRIVAQGMDEVDLTSLLHSIYHEDCIKDSVKLGSKGAIGLMGVPKIIFDICEEGIEGSMTFFNKGE